MLKLCESYDELGFMPSNPFCAKIGALALTYGFTHDFARFYRQGNSAAVGAVDGAVTLYCGEGADCEEIKSFLSFLGAGSIQGAAEDFEKLGLKAKKSSYIVKYDGSPAEKPELFTNGFEGREVYNLLTACGFDVGTYNDFAGSICLRLNKGTASFGAIKENGVLEACAFRLFENEKAVLLGAVATDEKCRGRGLASSLVPFMADKDKESYLFCRSDSLLEFYKKCGFSACGRWAESDEVK
jgi:GNAT superfamily N-acetyltransferase